MSRKTYSLSAATAVAVASLSFSNADGAQAFAQAIANDVVVEDAGLRDAPQAQAGLDQDSFETIPLAAQTAPVSDEPEFVSQEVVQPLPEPEQQPDLSSASSLRELVGTVAPGDLSEQMQCLAGAVYFESRGEPLSGQLAVAQVIINRAEDRRFPASYCGVVFQRAQFSFVKNGRMPSIRTSSPAWERAKSIAKIAHDGLWKSEAADAIYFHANYVRPKWSYRKTRTAQIDTHIFYR